MSYLDGVRIVCGRVQPLVDCEARGAAWSRSGRVARANQHVGDITDTVTDYDYGEKQVGQLVQFFNALGRPGEFESAVEAVYTSYEKARAWEPLGVDKALRWKNATAMKQVGADASALMEKLQRAYPGKSASVPSGGSSAVYAPSKSDGDNPWWKISVPWWAWTIGGVVAAGTVAAAVGPPIASILAPRAAVKRGR